LDFKTMMAKDLEEVFFDTNEFATEITLIEDEKEPQTIKAIFDIKTEIIENGEVVGHQPSILVTQEIEELIKHRSILEIEGKKYRKSYTDDEDINLIRVYLERV